MLSLRLFTSSGYSELSLGSDDSEGARVAYTKLMRIFGDYDPESQSLNVRFIQRKSARMEEEVTKFVHTYSHLEPRLNLFGKRIRDMSDKEHFLLVDHAVTSTSESLVFELLLRSLDAHPDDLDAQAVAFRDAISGMKQAFASTLANYSIHVLAPGRRVAIGEPDKDKRKCRFCGEGKAEKKSFNLKAHAIPEALGNKDVVLLEECDECNREFGRAVEPHLVRMFDIPRALYGIKGKGGNPLIQYSQADIFNRNGTFVIRTRGSDAALDPVNGQGSDEPPSKVRLGTVSGFIPLAAYRGFCKMALSLVPESHRPALRRTAAWLLNKYGNDLPLPNLAANILPADNDQPWQLAVYVREDDDQHIGPHVVGEYTMGRFVYVFALPFSDRDDSDLSGQSFENLYRAFTHYHGLPAWKTLDLSSPLPKTLDVEVHLQQRT